MVTSTPTPAAREGEQTQVERLLQTTLERFYLVLSSMNSAIPLGRRG